MGTIIIPEKEVKICDLCEREINYLTKCKVCSKEYCILCNGAIAGCVHQPDLCNKCCNLNTVQDIVEKYVPDFLKIIRERNKDFEKLKND